MPAKKPVSKSPVKKVPAKRQAKSSPRQDMIAQEENWRAESDLRILREAKQIEQDAGRMAKARKLADQELKALQAIKKQ
jgi:hypothetical protein